MELEQQKWKTKDGQVIDVKDMTDSHLNNAINYLQRKIDDAPCIGGYMGDGDAAVMTAEAEDDHNLRILEVLEKGLEMLEAEKKRRQSVSFTKKA